MSPLKPIHCQKLKLFIVEFIDFWLTCQKTIFIVPLSRVFSGTNSKPRPHEKIFGLKIRGLVLNLKKVRILQKFNNSAVIWLNWNRLLAIIILKCIFVCSKWNSDVLVQWLMTRYRKFSPGIYGQVRLWPTGITFFYSAMDWILCSSTKRPMEMANLITEHRLYNLFA